MALEFATWRTALSQRPQLSFPFWQVDIVVAAPSRLQPFSKINLSLFEIDLTEILYDRMNFKAVGDLYSEGKLTNFSPRADNSAVCHWQ